MYNEEFIKILRPTIIGLFYMDKLHMRLGLRCQEHSFHYLAEFPLSSKI